MILDECLTRFDHFPSVAEITATAAIMNIKGESKWKYFEIDHCEDCGGIGWHYYSLDGLRAVCACNSCIAGQNMQRAPKPHISFKMPAMGVYGGPGRKRKKSVDAA